MPGPSILCSVYDLSDCQYLSENRMVKEEEEETHNPLTRCDDAWEAFIGEKDEEAKSFSISRDGSTVPTRRRPSIR